MTSKLEKLIKAELKSGTNQNNQKNPSGHGKGIWQNTKTLDKYRAKRNAAKKLAKKNRRRQ